MELKEQAKETKRARLERISMRAAVTTRVVRDKTKYSRRIKHKGGFQ